MEMMSRSAKPSLYKSFCHSQGMLHVEDNEEEEFEIDINEQEPAFLKGQSTKNGGEVSPIKIVANPDGTLQVLVILQSCILSVIRIMMPCKQDVNGCLLASEIQHHALIGCRLAKGREEGSGPHGVCCREQQ